MPPPRCRCIECGFPLSETSTLWPTCAAIQRHVHKSPEDTQGSLGARSKQSISINCGSGTHIDAPAHFIPHGRTVEQLSVDELAQIPLAVIDVTAAVGRDPDFYLAVEHILLDEEMHGIIPPGALVCVRTGWAEQRYHNAAAYRNQCDLEDIDDYLDMPRMHFPGIGADAAALLVRERGAVGIGIDTLSPDGGSCGDGKFAAHHIILGEDRYILENLLLTNEVPPRSATAIVAPLYFEKAPEAPARVWVFAPE